MKKLSYFNCNIDSIIMFSIILPIMICTLILMKLFILGEIYKDHHGCWPISYYFGERSGCQRIIYEKVKNHQENFESHVSSSTFLNKIKTIFFNMKTTNLFFSEKIIQCQQYIFSFFFYFFKEIL